MSHCVYTDIKNIHAENLSILFLLPVWQENADQQPSILQYLMLSLKFIKLSSGFGKGNFRSMNRWLLRRKGFAYILTYWKMGEKIIRFMTAQHYFCSILSTVTYCHLPKHFHHQIEHCKSPSEKEIE